MIKINKSNYKFYKEVFKIIWKFEADYTKMDINSDYCPLNILENWEKQSESLARRGLKEGLRDSLIFLKDFPADSKTELNSSLISQNYPSINTLISKIKTIPKKVVEKGKIKNLDEYYIVKEILEDIDCKITESKRNLLNNVFIEFEQNYKEKR